MTGADRRRRARPLVAARALRQLVANPDDTVRVFEVINAMAGPALARGLARFRRTELGKRVLAERVDLLDLLRDREKLRTLPEGTLGRAYHDFVYGESLTAEGLVAASMNETVRTYGFDDADLARFGARMRGSGAFADLIEQMFEGACRRAGLDNGRVDLRTDLFRRPAGDPRQLTLFPETDK